eukprot:4016317-Alexandrium_andersonii.AAC.1
MQRVPVRPSHATFCSASSLRRARSPLSSPLSRVPWQPEWTCPREGQLMTGGTRRRRRGGGGAGAGA